MLSCKFCEIFKNTFTEHLMEIAPVQLKKKTSTHEKDEENKNIISAIQNRLF